MIDYSIISTGSKGNAVVISATILIDCGVPFKSLKNIYKDFQLVLLTHIHGDHFNRTTVKKLAQERPVLRWGAPEWLIPDLIKCDVDPNKIDVTSFNESMFYGNFIVQAVPLSHNVPNCGYKICFDICGKREHLFYATDTNNLDGIEAKDYDLYMLEANYSEPEITERIRQKQAAGEYCHEWDVLNNHLSKEKADNWLYQNMGANSRYMYLHQHEGSDI